MANKIVIVAGLPGAGKTTVLNEFSHLKNTTIINIGNTMLEVALEKKYVKVRDEIRYLNNDKINELRHLSIKKIISLSGNIILDTHASVGENGRYLPGLPLKALDQFGGVISGLIYIDASTEDIIARRKNDKTRKREHEDKALIDNQRLINLSTLTLASSYLNVPLFVVVNRPGPDGISMSVKEIDARLGELLEGA